MQTTCTYQIRFAKSWSLPRLQKYNIAKQVKSMPEPGQISVDWWNEMPMPLSVVNRTYHHLTHLRHWHSHHSFTFSECRHHRHGGKNKGNPNETNQNLKKSKKNPSGTVGSSTKTFSKSNTRSHTEPQTEKSGVEVTWDNESEGGKSGDCAARPSERKQRERNAGVSWCINQRANADCPNNANIPETTHKKEIMA